MGKVRITPKEISNERLSSFKVVGVPQLMEDDGVYWTVKGHPFHHSTHDHIYKTITKLEKLDRKGEFWIRADGVLLAVRVQTTQKLL